MYAIVRHGSDSLLCAPLLQAFLPQLAQKPKKSFQKNASSATQNRHNSSANQSVQ